MYNMCKKLRQLTKFFIKVGYAVTLLEGSTTQNSHEPRDYLMHTFSMLLMIVSSNSKYVWELYDVISETWFNMRKRYLM